MSFDTPEDAVTYLLEQAKKFRALNELVVEGMADVQAGRISEWNVDDFLREARAIRPNQPP
jgi:hypothetical protein